MPRVFEVECIIVSLYFLCIYVILFVHCRCLKDVNDRIESLKQPGETDKAQYDDHTLFRQEHDEQLLLWTQRYEVCSTNFQ